MKFSLSEKFKSNYEFLDRICLFRDLSCEYQLFAKDAGIDLVPFYDSGLPLFSAQSELKQIEILEALEVCVKICRATHAQGFAMQDSPQLIWQALKELGFRPPSDLFSHMSDSHVIEIYSRENTQIFRSFNFFRYCSYSLEELYCKNWVHLFSRDHDAIIPMIMEFSHSVFNGTLRHTVSLRHIPEHIVRETSSLLRFKLKVGIHWGAPLFRENTSEPAGAIVLETGEMIGKDLPVENKNLELVPLHVLDFI